jgi:AraC-like DNA-binding protein
MTGNGSAEYSKYLTCSDRDQRWGIYCTCLGWCVAQPGSPFPPEPAQHPLRYLRAWKKGPKARRVFDTEFQLHYVTRGRGVFYQGDDKSWKIVAGSVFLLFPGIPHWYAPDKETGWDEHWVGFSGNYPMSLLEQDFLSTRQPVLHVGLYESLMENFQDLVDIAKAEPPAFQQRLGALIINLIAQIRSYTKEKKFGSDAEEIIRRARFRFVENLHAPLDIEEFAAQLGLDYASFRKLFKSYTGLSPYQYFLQLKIHRAQHLLQEDNLSVKEIAFMLGFDNQYYFSRIFKKKTGSPPSQWRNQRSQ